MRPLLAVALLTSMLCMATIARADIADQRTTELLGALQAGKFDEAAAHFDVRMRGGLPPDKLESVWNQLTAQYGPLKSFEISQRTSTNGVDVRIADLHFARASGLSAQVAIDSADAWRDFSLSPRRPR